MKAWPSQRRLRAAKNSWDFRAPGQNSRKSKRIWQLKEMGNICAEVVLIGKCAASSVIRGNFYLTQETRIAIILFHKIWTGPSVPFASMWSQSPKIGIVSIFGRHMATLLRNKSCYSSKWLLLDVLGSTFAKSGIRQFCARGMGISSVLDPEAIGAESWLTILAGHVIK